MELALVQEMLAHWGRLEGKSTAYCDSARPPARKCVFPVVVSGLPDIGVIIAKSSSFLLTSLVLCRGWHLHSFCNHLSSCKHPSSWSVNVTKYISLVIHRKAAIIKVTNKHHKRQCYELKTSKSMILILVLLSLSQLNPQTNKKIL